MTLESGEDLFKNMANAPRERFYEAIKESMAADDYMSASLMAMLLDIRDRLERIEKAIGPKP